MILPKSEYLICVAAYRHLQLDKPLEIVTELQPSSLLQLSNYFQRINKTWAD